MNKEYIMIGTNVISKEIFRNILRPLDNYSFIPNGGFWSSEYTGNERHISPWFNYLLYAEEIAGKKNLEDAVIFTLKNNAKILTITTYEQVLELSKNYPSYHHILGYNGEITNKTTSFDFEKLSKYYDGIYVDFRKLSNENKTTIFKDWSVNTLLLFNLNCIKEYRQAKITYIQDEPYYSYIDSKDISSSLIVSNTTPEYRALSSIASALLQKYMNKYNNYPFKDYDEYLTILIKEVKLVIKEIIEKNDILINTLLKNLKEQNISIDKNTIISNIAKNYLTTYLINNEERIKSLPKSKVKELKWYTIN